MSMKLFNKLIVGQKNLEVQIARMQAEAQVYGELINYMDSEGCRSEWRPDGNGGYICGNCNFSYNTGDPGKVFNFCPECGDRMMAAQPQGKEVEMDNSGEAETSVPIEPDEIQ